jgi:mannosyltransferase
VSESKIRPTAARLPGRPSRLFSGQLGPTAVAFAIAAAGLSVAGSWIPSFWGDEAASLMSAQRPLPSLFTMLGNVDAVHGTYYLLLHFWIDAFGASPFSARLPSALAVGVAVAGTVVLAGRLAGTRAALFAGVVAMLLPRLTSVGTETRSFAFTAALAIWLTVLLVQLVGPGRRHGGWALYTLLVAASAYLFLFSLLIPLAHALALAYAPATRRMLRAWLASMAAGTVLAAPILVWGFLERNQISYLSHRSAASWYPVVVGQWFGNPVYAAMVLVLLVAAAAIAVFQWNARGRRTRVLGHAGPARLNIVVLAGAVAFVPPAVLLIANIFGAVYTNRYLAMSAPAVAVLIGFLLSRIPRAWGIVALLALTLSAIPSYLQQRTPFAKNDSDWAQVAEIVGSRATTGDAVVFDDATRPSLRLRLALHTYPRAFAGLNDITLNVPYAENTWWWDKTYKVKTVADRFKAVNRVWLLEYRPAGQPPDTYGLADLRALGFDVAATYPGHRSVVYDLTRTG